MDRNFTNKIIDNDYDNTIDLSHIFEDNYLLRHLDL